ncbi:MAG: TadE family type IV pilus minor pilin [Actinomycetota bacterium]
MATAELAAALPVLMILLAVALTAVSAAGQRVRAQDAAREAARAAARGDLPTAQRLAKGAAPDASVDVSRSASDVVAHVRIILHPLAGWLPKMTIDERAVAALEPDSAGSRESSVPP